MCYGPECGLSSECEKNVCLSVYLFIPGCAASPPLPRLSRAVCGPSRAAASLGSQLSTGLAASQHAGPSAAGTAPVAPARAGRFLTSEPAGVSLRKRVLLWRMPSVDVHYVRFTAEPSSPTSFLVSACRVSSLTGVWKSPTITMDHRCLFCSCLKIHFIWY